MALDLSMDFATHDLRVAPNKDIQAVTGPQVVAQRIRVRLNIYQGEWTLDPSDGTLGSTLHDVARLPIWRSLKEVPLVVKEALQPMTDIDVREVDAVQNADNPKQVDVTIFYAILDDTSTGVEQTLSFTTTIAG